MTDENPTKFSILSIDAWRESDGGWTWNDAHIIERGVYFGDEALTPRKILRAFRRWGYLNENSKGKVAVRDEYFGTNNLVGSDIIEIVARGTGEPIFALSTVH